MFKSWYWPKARMSTEDWLFVAALTGGGTLAFWLGFGIGLIITK